MRSDEHDGDALISPDEVLAEVRRCGARGLVRYSTHALRRMDERNVREKDVLCALRSAARCGPADRPGRWKVFGQDLDDDELVLVVVLQAGVIVVTVF